MRRLPFTLIFLATLVLANWAAGTLQGTLPLKALAGWGISHRNIVEGETFRLLTGTFLSHDLAMFARQMVFAATVIGLYEWNTGSLRTATLFFSVDLIGTLIVVFIVLPVLAATPLAGPSALQSYDVGMSAGGFGLIGALAAMQRRAVLLFALVLAAIVIKVWFSFDIIADSAHVVCLLLGFTLQTALPFSSARACEGRI